LSLSESKTYHTCFIDKHESIVMLGKPTKKIKKSDFITINFFDKCDKICQKRTAFPLFVLTSLLAFIMIFFLISWPQHNIKGRQRSSKGGQARCRDELDV